MPKTFRRLKKNNNFTKRKLKKKTKIRKNKIKRNKSRRNKKKLLVGADRRVQKSIFIIVDKKKKNR